MPPSPPPTAPPASVHGDQRGRGDGRRGRSLVNAIERRLPKIKVGSGADADAEMGRLVAREHRDKVASDLRKRPAGGRPAWSTGGAALYQEDKGFFLGVSLLDNVTPEMECYPQRDLRAGDRGRARPDLRRCDAGLIEDNPYANGTANYTRDGGAAGQFKSDVNVGMVGINVPIPVPVGVLLASAAGRAPSSATWPCTVRRGCSSHPGQGGHLALARSWDGARWSWASREPAGQQ